MKRIVLVTTMFLGISNSAADLQGPNTPPQKASILETIYGAPGALLRSVATSYDETTQRKMFGFDEHQNCEEHQRTLRCHDYFCNLLKKIPLPTPIDPVMKDQCKKRKNIFAYLTYRILEERNRDQIGDQQSPHVIIRIERLLECAPVFGSEELVKALNSYKNHISNNLIPFIPNQSEKENDNEDAS